MKNLLMSSIIAIILGGVLLGGLAPCAASANLVQTVQACEEWYPLGEQVPFVYTLKNTGAQSIAYDFRSGKQYDIWVTFGGKEVYRASSGMMYIQSFTNLTIGSGQTKEFRVTWNQKDTQGNAVGTGWYTVHAQLESMREKPYEVSSRIWIGELTPVVVGPLTLQVGEAMKRSFELAGKTVTMSGNLKEERMQAQGSRSIGTAMPSQLKMILSDSTGSIDVSGIDPKQIGSDEKVTLSGKLCKSSTGQVYLSVETQTAPRVESLIIEKSLRGSVLGGRRKPQ
ncbi:MAG: BsuPI-related putative proteinase inhibitor [Armatimonadetes bacterium]|nr:BsuPI-related putative proteinase inhibitor [Armatimonadota bacterium]